MGLLTLLLVTLATPVLAHTALKAAAPAEGARVSQRLDAVVLRFTESVDAEGAAVEVTDADSQVVSRGRARVRGARVTQTIEPTRRGRHTVRFQVFATDGHELEDRFAFRYAGPVPGAATDEAGEPTEKATAQPDDETTEQATAQSDEMTEQGAAPRPAPTAPDGAPASTVVVVAVLAAGVFAVGAGAMAYERRRPRGR